MSGTFNCPNCSAPLDYREGSGATVRCPYCSSSVIVPESLRGGDVSGQADFFWQPGAMMDHAMQAENLARLKQIGDLVRAGQLQGAIQLFQQTFNTGLAEAQSAVEALAQNRSVNLTGLTINIPATMQPSLDAATMSRIQGLVRQGNKIEAIRLFREATNLGLKQAKEAVEDIEQVMRLQPGQPGVLSWQPSAPTIDRRAVSTVAKVGGAATAGASCFVVGLVLFILLVTFVPIFFALTSSGGPWADWWTRVNPFGERRLLLSFGGEGTGVGVFEDARHIGVDNNGHIFVGEYEGGRIQVFDTDGVYITQWIARGAVEGNDIYLTGLAVDRNSVVYVTVGSDLYYYNGLTGEPLGTLEHPEGWGFDDVTVAPDGSILAAWDKGHDDIIRFNRDLQMDLLIQSAISGVSDDSELTTRLAADGQGNIYALGTFNYGVFVFAPDGRFVSRFGSEGDSEGQFTSPHAIAVDNKSQIYVSDFGGIMIFASDGRYLDTISTNGFVFGMTFDDQGNLYYVTSNEMVYVLAPAK